MGQIGKIANNSVRINHIDRDKTPKPDLATAHLTQALKNNYRLSAVCLDPGQISVYSQTAVFSLA